MPQISDDAEALDKLAEKCGIESEFWDLTGQSRPTLPETKRLLLAAMGLAAQNSSQVASSLSEIEREEWKEGLPEIVVAYSDRPISVELVLPRDHGDISWQLTLESGDVRTGRAKFENLELIKLGADDSKLLEKRRLPLDNDLPWGYDSLKLDRGRTETTLVVTPGRCWLPPNLANGQKLGGLAAQLYLLRSSSNWGIGDFSDLRRLLEIGSRSGAQIVGINPIHAMFIGNPEHASPYSPSHRSLLNVLYLDVAALPELADCQEAQQLIASADFRRKLDACRAVRYVDYANIATLKLQVLQLLFARWQAAPHAQRLQSFEAFKQSKSESWRRACVFEALCQEFASGDSGLTGWKNWPAEYRNPVSAETDRFANRHQSEIEFHAWLQWLADEQLKNAVTAGTQMSVGLYGDLAVGSHPDGSEAWANQHALAANVSVGAPPDDFNREGQNWGLPPYNPHALRRLRYRPFIELIRANMRHRGALRIDHAMALQHLYWVPDQHSAKDGAYVSYPFDDLLGLLSLESHRNKCLIIAEDLGTVPAGFRERMTQANILSYRVLLFERKPDTAFAPPGEYPGLSVAVASNHDLPTLRSWWEASDLEVKVKAGLLRHEELERERDKRDRDQQKLLEALRAEGLIPSEGTLHTDAIIEAVHAYLSRAGSLVALAQLDDITKETDPVNLPGTVEQYPNWRRRLSVSLEDLTQLCRRLENVMHRV
jgi:4-alpha-glucanotransferase